MKIKSSLLLAALFMIMTVGVAWADYTVVNITAQNTDAEDTVAVEIHETSGDNYKVSALSPGGSYLFTHQATAWFWTTTVYTYSVKVFQMGNPEAICEYQYQMANRWDFTNWDFGPKVRWTDITTVLEGPCSIVNNHCENDAECSLTVNYGGQ